jgi:hypothetical protein
MITKPEDLAAWVKEMRRLGVRTLTTGGVGIELDPTGPSSDPFEDLVAEAEERRQAPIDPAPGMCRQCGENQANSLMPGTCRKCAGNAWTESLS